MIPIRPVSRITARAARRRTVLASASTWKKLIIARATEIPTPVPATIASPPISGISG